MDDIIFFANRSWCHCCVDITLISCVLQDMDWCEGHTEARLLETEKVRFLS